MVARRLRRIEKGVCAENDLTTKDMKTIIRGKAKVS